MSHTHAHTHHAAALCFFSFPCLEEAGQRTAIHTVRHASAALQSLNNVDMGKQLVVLQLATPNPAAQHESWAAAALAYASEAGGGMPRVRSDQALTDLGSMMPPMLAPNMLNMQQGMQGLLYVAVMMMMMMTMCSSTHVQPLDRK